MMLFNVVLMVFIVATMLAAGLGTTTAALGAVLRRPALVALVLLANLVVVPVLGWAVAAALALPAAAYAALLLVACSPGAPFGAKLAMVQKGDATTGSALQVLLAAVGSVTFPFTANAILTAADLGAGLSLPVGDLVTSVAVLQLVPFVIGFVLRNWAPDTAHLWSPTADRVSNVAFLAVLALGLLGSWQQVIGLVGSRTLLAGAIFGILAAAAGALLAVGPPVTRTTVALLAPMRNAGPAFAAVAIGFGGDSATLAALTGVQLVILVMALPVASWLARRRTPVEQQAAPAGHVDTSTPDPARRR